MRRTRALCLLTTATLGLVALTSCSAASKEANKAASKAVVLPADALTAMGLASREVDAVDSAKISGDIRQPGTTQVEHITGSLKWGTTGLANLKMSGLQAFSEFAANGVVPVRLVDGVMYISADSAAAAQLNGKHWMKLDFAELGASEGGAGASLGSSLGDVLKQFSPVQTVRELAADKGVRSVGVETVDGVKATHYTGTVTLAQMAAATPGISAADRKALISADSKIGLKGETLDVWLNAKALPVRVKESATTTKGAMVIDRHFSDYGVPVSAPVPPASDTLDLAAAVKAAKKS